MSKTKKKPRGKPFAKGDPRINREGVSPDAAKFNALVRERIVALGQQRSRFATDADQFQSRVDRVIARAWDQAEGGDHRAREWLLGLPAQTLEISGPGGEPIRFVWDIAAGQRSKA